MNLDWEPTQSNSRATLFYVILSVLFLLGLVVGFVIL